MPSKPKTKRCTMCDERKNKEKHFHKNKAQEDGYNRYCKACVSLRYQEATKKKEKKPIPKYKVCSCCGVKKPGTEFYRYYATADGLQGHCKECKRRQDRERRGLPPAEQCHADTLHALRQHENPRKVFESMSMEEADKVIDAVYEINYQSARASRMKMQSQLYWTNLLGL